MSLFIELRAGHYVLHVPVSDSYPSVIGCR